jgi:hypothetical protein
MPITAAGQQAVKSGEMGLVPQCIGDTGNENSKVS